MGLKQESNSKKETGLISTIPGAVQSIKEIQSLEAQIALIEVQQQEAMEKLKLDIVIEKAKQGQNNDLVQLDEAARKLYEAFHPKV